MTDKTTDTTTGEAAGQSPAAEPKKTANIGVRRPLTTGTGSLLSGGVATQRLFDHATPKVQNPASQAGVVDPAADLPMYRDGMDWFVLRVASNKEDSVRVTLLRKVQIEGMHHLVGRIMVPTEKNKVIKDRQQKITETKLYPGYVFVEMRLEPDGRIPQDVFFLIKETTGVGDFVGTAGRPTPMIPTEVEKMLFDSRKPEESGNIKMEFAKGDHVTVIEGPFVGHPGTVDEVFPDRQAVRILVTIFGRQAPLEVEYWLLQKAES
ncbi:MAG: transcription termination/antitermination protein NusG [Planctomycetota bacterium]|nr:transcription termination/antitermination protein NusG [Planctomycetota bacterium]MDA1105887.1 transcription termination/antitermination protein NusG [Planctomycetota bacterium]